MSHVKYESMHENINRWKINNLRRSCNFVPAQRSLYIIRSNAQLSSVVIIKKQDGYYANSIAVSLFLIIAREICL